MSKQKDTFTTSVRRVSVALLTVGILSQSLVTGLLLVGNCGEEGVGCLASAVTFGIPALDTTVPTTLDNQTALATTPDMAVNEPTTVEGIMSLIQVTGLYLVLLAVVILVALESIELYYLRRLLRQRWFSW